MITRKHLRLDFAVKYSWQNILYSSSCTTAAYLSNTLDWIPDLRIPIAVVAVLGTAIAIILGFRNASAYDRWWEARKIWGGVVNESRTVMRQSLTLVDPSHIPDELVVKLNGLVRLQVAWVNSLRLQLRQRMDAEQWKHDVGRHMDPETFAEVMRFSNKVTQIGMVQGRTMKTMHIHGIMDTFLFIQITDTLTRLTDLQGRAERIKATPLPRPYDYYTHAFLNLFIFFFPFGVIGDFQNLNAPLLIFPVTMIVGWIFYQIYVFGKVMSSPFKNWNTDIPLDAITNTIEIDLLETIGASDVPKKHEPVNGTLM